MVSFAKTALQLIFFVLLMPSHSVRSPVRYLCTHSEWCSFPCFDIVRVMFECLHLCDFAGSRCGDEAAQGNGAIQIWAHDRVELGKHV